MFLGIYEMVPHIKVPAIHLATQVPASEWIHANWLSKVVLSHTHTCYGILKSHSYTTHTLTHTINKINKQDLRRPGWLNESKYLLHMLDNLCLVSNSWWKKRSNFLKLTSDLHTNAVAHTWCTIRMSQKGNVDYLTAVPQRMWEHAGNNNWHQSLLIATRLRCW